MNKSAQFEFKSLALRFPACLWGRLFFCIDPGNTEYFLLFLSSLNFFEKLFSSFPLFFDSVVMEQTFFGDVYDFDPTP